MAATAQTVAATLANLFAGTITLVPKGYIGTIVIQATLEEQLIDTLEMTEHPLQVNAVATDHSFLRPQEVVLTCAWSNSGGSVGLGSLGDIALAALDTITPFPLAAADILKNAANLQPLISGIGAGAVFNAQPFSPDYVGGVYSQLVTLMQGRQPFNLFTTARTYQNMLLTELMVTRDRSTSLALMVRAVCRQLLFVDTETSTLPPQRQQADAPNTATTVSGGTLTPVSATLANAGSVPAINW